MMESPRARAAPVPASRHGASDDAVPRCWITHIKKSGEPGSKMPIDGKLTIGRDEVQCDVCIRLPDVDAKHVQVTIDETGSVWLDNLTVRQDATHLNGEPVAGRTRVSNNDEMHVCGRKFRFIIEGTGLRRARE